MLCLDYLDGDRSRKKHEPNIKKVTKYHMPGKKGPYPSKTRMFYKHNCLHSAKKATGGDLAQTYVYNDLTKFCQKLSGLLFL